MRSVERLEPYLLLMEGGGHRLTMTKSDTGRFTHFETAKDLEAKLLDAQTTNHTLLEENIRLRQELVTVKEQHRDQIRSLSDQMADLRLKIDECQASGGIV